VFESATTSISDALDETNAVIGRMQRRMLHLIADADRLEIWRDSGARDTAHWVAIRNGISEWKSRRWVAAAHALEKLPLIAEALERGELGIDKVVELARFAAPETEARLLRWAMTVSVGAVRHRGDLEAKASITDVRETERSREVTWWYFDEGRRFGLEADLPAASGPVIVNALEREAERIAALPGEEDEVYASARRADALVALCSARIATDPEPDRATVVVHARLDGLEQDTGGCEIEGGPVIHPQSVRRLLCNARGADGRGRSRRHRAGDRTAEPPGASVDGPPGPPPRPGVPVPRLRRQAVHRGTSPAVVAPRGQNRPSQPGAHLLVPPPAGARARLVGETRGDRRSPVAPSRWDALRIRPVAG
jgi:hypothetical protein